MMSTSTLALSVVAATLLLTSLPVESKTAWKTDIKVKYYSTVILRCHPSLTVIPGVRKIFWITPEAAVIEESTPANQMPENVKLGMNVVGRRVITLLNVTHVADDVFGYYTCITTDVNGDVVSLARWGLNVNGADFSELEEKYRENAIIGGIAAAVMMAVVGVSCVLWHFRFSQRATRNQKAAANGQGKLEIKEKTGGMHSMQVAAVMSPSDVPPAVVDMGHVNPTFNGEVESVRM